MQLRATSLSAGSSAIGAKQSSIAKMISALRMLGGTLIYAPDNALGDGAPNLLSAPEDFAGASWVKIACSVTPNAVVAPDGTMTASKLVESNTTTQHYVYQSVTLTAGLQYTLTYRAKAGERRRLLLREATASGYSVAFDLLTGTVVGTTGAATGDITPSDNGYYVCRMTFPAVLSGATVLSAYPLLNSGTTFSDAAYTGDGASGIYIWGAKLEPGSVATAYTPQSVLRQRGVYVDNVGTQPVTAVGDLIGKVLDKTGTNHATQSAVASKPSVQRVPKRLGPNLVGNGTFDSGTTGWTAYNGGGVSAIGGELVLTNVSTAYGRASFALNTEVGKSYSLQSQGKAGTSGLALIGWGAGFGTAGANQVSTTSATTTQLSPIVFTATSTTSYVVLQTGSITAGQTAIFDNIEVREVLEWATVISFDGSNDFLQTDISTGNEGWICAGVAFGGAAGVNETVAEAGATGVTTNKGVWLFRWGNAGANRLEMRVGNGTTVTTKEFSTTPLLGVPRVVEGGWDASNVHVGVDGVVASKARTGDASPSASVLRIGGYQGTANYLNGPMHAIAYAPVLPDAATRKIIRNGIAALQGRTL